MIKGTQALMSMKQLSKKVFSNKKLTNQILAPIKACGMQPTA